MMIARSDELKSSQTGAMPSVSLRSARSYKAWALSQASMSAHKSPKCFTTTAPSGISMEIVKASNEVMNSSLLDDLKEVRADSNAQINLVKLSWQNFSVS